MSIDFTRYSKPLSYQTQPAIICTKDGMIDEIVDTLQTSSIIPCLNNLKIINNIIYTPDYFSDRFAKSCKSSLADAIKEFDQKGKYTSKRIQIEIDHDAEEDLKNKFRDRLKAYDKRTDEIRKEFLVPGEVPVRFSFYAEVNRKIHEAIYNNSIIGTDVDRLADFYIHTSALLKSIAIDNTFTQPGMVIDPMRKDEYKDLCDKIARECGVNEYTDLKNKLKESCGKKEIVVLSGNLSRINKLGGRNNSGEIIDIYNILVAEAFQEFLNNNL